MLDRGVVAARVGGDVVAALRAEEQAPADGLAQLGTIWELSADGGVGMADAVDRIRQSLADSERVRRELAGQLAGPRATGLVLAALPLVGVGLGELLGASPTAWLTGTPAGWAVLLAALSLDAAGLAWTFRISQRISRLL